MRAVEVLLDRNIKYELRTVWSSDTSPASSLGRNRGIRDRAQCTVQPEIAILRKVDPPPPTIVAGHGHFNRVNLAWIFDRQTTGFRTKLLHLPLKGAEAACGVPESDSENHDGNRCKELSQRKLPGSIHCSNSRGWGQLLRL